MEQQNSLQVQGLGASYGPRVVLAEVGFQFIARARAPLHFAGIDMEEHGAHDTVLQRAAIAVAIVGARDAGTGLIRVVLHKGNRRGIAAKRRSRQQQASPGGASSGRAR